MKSVHSLVLIVLVALGLGFSIWVGQGPELSKTEDTIESVIRSNLGPVVLIGLNPRKASHREFVKQWIEVSKNLEKPVESIIAQTSVSTELSELGDLDSFEPERDNHGVYAALKKATSGPAGRVLVLTDQVQSLSVAQSSLASLFSEQEQTSFLRLVLVSPEPIKESAFQRISCPDQKLTECMTKRSQLLAQLRTKEDSASLTWWQWSTQEKLVYLGRF